MTKEVNNIFQAINAVMLEMTPISKDRKNTSQNYKFRGIDDAMNAFAPLFAKHGMFPTLHEALDVQSDEVTSNSGTKGYHLIKRYTVRFYALDGTFLDVISDGEAIDYGDKASNKAMSVAYREAIFKTFIVPFGNDDIENASHDIKTTSKTFSQQSGTDTCKDCGKPLTMRKNGNGGYCSGVYNKSCPPKALSDSDQKISDEIDTWPHKDDEIPTILIDKDTEL